MADALRRWSRRAEENGGDAVDGLAAAVRALRLRALHGRGGGEGSDATGLARRLGIGRDDLRASLRRLTFGACYGAALERSAVLGGGRVPGWRLPAEIRRADALIRRLERRPGTFTRSLGAGSGRTERAFPPARGTPPSAP